MSLRVPVDETVINDVVNEVPVLMHVITIPDNWARPEEACLMREEYDTLKTTLKLESINDFEVR